MKNLHEAKQPDDGAYELLVAEEELILHAQMLIQRVLNENGVSQKKLAEKMGVSESYVSQMLGLSARNLTLRTIARVMKALDVRATLVLDDHVDAEASATSSTTIVAEDEVHEAKSVASRLASVQSSQVWGEVIALPPRQKSRRRQDADAKAFASYDPPVREMEPEAELALAA